MENVLQKLDAVMKDESTSLPFAISFQNMESPTKKTMINQQVSLASQKFKNWPLGSKISKKNPAANNVV